MSLVIDAPETLPAAAPPTIDDAPARVSRPATSSSWWRTLISRFNRPLFTVSGAEPPPEAAIDRLAREHTFLYIKALSG
ncbi:MAG: hypothetical protein OEU26_20050 [Candidatus Tectomicrobia bacterium]|nr:hypothetical protein [Candidatus Tectomicrobia bacterium]